ncbi:MAG: twin-arginine translocation signal domain-containing protein [Rhodobacteraceae bacterium]|nr:twin-arginine translocation signal domain-containing protein [Paracoccaceae bacterium]
MTYMYAPAERLERDAYNKMAATARNHGGRWSRFGKPGFLFKTEADRQAFIDAISPSNDTQQSRKDLSRRDFLKTASSIAVGAALPRGLNAAPRMGKALPLPDAVASTPLSDEVISLLEANDLKGALALLAESGPKETRVLARILARQMPDTGADVVIDSTSRTNSHGMVAQKDNGGAVLTLYTANDSTGTDTGTFLHEALHMAVMARYSSLNRALKGNYRVLGMDDAAARDAMDQFIDLWQEFRTSFKGAQGLEMSEALSSPDEFFVRALTDPAVQKSMAEKEYDGRTLMQRFKDWVKYSLFGLNKKGVIPSWLDAALLGANDFIDAMDNDSPDFAYADRLLKAVNEQNRQRETMHSRRESVREGDGGSYGFAAGGSSSGATPPPTEGGNENIDREEMNRRMREEHHGIWWKAKTAAKRNLSPGGLLPRAVFNAKIARDSKMGAAEMDVQYHVAALERAFKKDFKTSFDNRTVKQARMLRDALAGNPSPDLPQDTAVAIEAMRQYIDRHSAAYVEILREDARRMLDGLPADRRLAILDQLDSGEFDDLKKGEAQIVQKILLMDTIAGNIGEYVHRSYRAFDDPHWARNVPNEVLDNARDYLESRHLEQNPESTIEEAAKAADRIIESILKENTAFDSMEAYIRESKLGAKDLSLLKRRKDIAPEIRELLGEYEDPRLNFAKSATKMTRLIFNDAFLKRVREIGLGTFLFEDGEQPPGHWKTIAAEGNEAYAPLNGLKTTPEINQAFIDALGNENMESWYRAIVRMNGAVKFGKTVLSPTTAARNFMSAMFFTLGNSHFNLGHAGMSLRVHLDKQGDNYDYLRHLKELGVVYDTPYAEEMMRLLRDTDLQDRLLNDRMKAKHALDMAQSFYRFGDDFWKVIGFENEVAIQMKHYGMGRAEAEKEAAERIRNTYPTYSMTGRFVNKLRRFPLAGTFVSFPAEIIRTSYHILRYAKQDMEHSKSLGAQRLAGLAITAGLAYAAQALSMLMLGVDDDEDEAVRQQLPEWSKNSNLYYLSREDGNLRYLDLSFLDPYNYWKRPITAILRDQPLKESAQEAAREMLAPFFGTDIAFGALAEIWSNKKSSGGTVYNSADTALEQSRSIADHIRKAIQPGAFSNLERILKAGRGEKTTTGRTYSMSDEMAALAGFRVSTLDPGVSLKYRSYETQDAIRGASSILRKAATDPNPVSEDELRDTFDRVTEIREEAYQDLLRSITAAKRSGLSDAAVLRQLQSGGLSKKDAAALASGIIPVNVSSKQYLRDAISSAGDTFGPDVQREILKRRSLIMRWQSELLQRQ